ncbi:MAG: DegV family protein [Nanoarchaeota archaeon]|nr:DegV family protein [Nanoarchaeota archaeon]
MKASGRIRILVDGTIDYLPATDKRLVHEVSVHTFLNDKEVRIGKKDFYDKITNWDNVFKTSQANPEDFIKVFNKFKNDKLIVLTVSSILSGTYNSGLTAAKLFKNPITIIDSKTTSAAMGLLVDKAVDLLKKGENYEEIIKQVKEMVPKVKIFFVVKNLNYLVRGGRVNKVLGAFGRLINLKPVLEIAEGALKSAGKMLVLNDFVNGFQSFVSSKINSAEKIYLIHNNLDKETKELIDFFKKKYEVIVMDYLTPVLGVHVGPECVAIGWVEE